MKIKFFHIIFFILLAVQNIHSQEDEELKIVTEKQALKKKDRPRIPYNPLTPAKAAFYSAILPGLGQAYTKKYWKIPIVYAALGTGVYLFIKNDENYNRARDIYKRRLAGHTDDEFPNITNDQLISLQDNFRRDKELSLLISVGLYILNIVDANVTGHLLQYDISDDLSFNPKINFNKNIPDKSLNYGIALKYQF